MTTMGRVENCFDTKRGYTPNQRFVVKFMGTNFAMFSRLKELLLDKHWIKLILGLLEGCLLYLMPPYTKGEGSTIYLKLGQASPVIIKALDDF